MRQIRTAVKGYPQLVLSRLCPGQNTYLLRMLRENRGVRNNRPYYIYQRALLPCSDLTRITADYYWTVLVCPRRQGQPLVQVQAQINHGHLFVSKNIVGPRITEKTREVGPAFFRSFLSQDRSRTAVSWHYFPVFKWGKSGKDGVCKWIWIMSTTISPVSSFFFFFWFSFVTMNHVHQEQWARQE